MYIIDFRFFLQMIYLLKHILIILTIKLLVIWDEKFHRFLNYFHQVFKSVCDIFIIEEVITLKIFNKCLNKADQKNNHLENWYYKILIRTDEDLCIINAIKFRC